jgi:uncharacterized protein (UPF0248 family)
VDRVVLAGRARLPRKADRVVRGTRISMADQVALVFREDLEVPVDPVVLAGRLPRKADRVVRGTRISMADQVALVFREDLEVPVDRVVLAGRARLPRKADRVVRGTRISMADQVALVFVPVDPVVLVGRARPPTKQRPLEVMAKVAKGADARKTPTCLAANSSCAWVASEL